METSSADQSLRDALECPVCKDLFTEPKQLDCGHTYCLSCVNALEKVPNVVHRIVGEDFFGVGPFVQSVQNNVQCPQCRKMCLVPDIGLSTNYTIKEMVDKFRETAKLADDDMSFLRLGDCAATQPTKKEQQKHCHACAKKVPESELFICKDCNKPAKKQFICALCVVRSHKQHAVLTLDCLAVARERELAALRIEEIMVHAQRMGDEARGMQHDITKQFETMRERLEAKLNSFHQLQNECLDSEQNPLKEQVEGKVCEAIHKCEQLNEHFLRLRELKTEFEGHIHRWQNELTADDAMASSLLSFSPSAGVSPPSTLFCGLAIPQTHRYAETGQTTTPTSSARSAHPSHFVFSNCGGDDRFLAELLSSTSGSAAANNKKAQPILVAQRRRSRLRGGAGGAGFASSAGGGGPSGGGGSSSMSVSSMIPTRGSACGDGEHQQQHFLDRDLFSFVDQ